MNKGEVSELLETAFTLGIRSYDTAPIYGNGKSESFIGEIFSPVRKDIRIISKFGFSIVNGRSVYDVSSEGIKSQLNESLNRLKTDFIDTYLLHIPQRIENPNQIINTLNELTKRWLIRQYGLSNCSWDLLKQFLSIKGQNITVIQDFYNLIDRGVEKSIFPYIDESIEFMAYSPLYRGWLTQRSMAEILKRDENALNMLFRNQGLKQFLRDRKLYEIIAERKNKTLKELALEFLMHEPHVSSIIFGTSDKNHIHELYLLFQEKYI